MTALLDRTAAVPHTPAAPSTAAVPRVPAPAPARSTIASPVWLAPTRPAPVHSVVPSAARPRPARMAPPRPGPAPSAERAHPNPAPLLLTRRARLLCTTSVLAAALLITGVAAANAGSAPGYAPVVSSVVVGPGDTLWQVAGEIAPGADTAEVVRRLREVNGLRGNTVQPGQVLTVPAG